MYRVPNSIKDAKEEKIGKEQLSKDWEAFANVYVGGAVPSEYLVTNVKSN